MVAMMPWSRLQTWNLILAAVFLTWMMVVGCARTGDSLSYSPEIKESGQGFPLGDLLVSITFGYSDDGDRLRYLVILSWPSSTLPSARLADPRFDQFSTSLPLVRHEDGVMRPVGTDGHVYLFIGDELRTMRVAMNEHTDPNGLSDAKSLEEMWEFLQTFRVEE
jgi:hypothetical protein